MVHFLAISLFLLPIVTASGDEFWDDVDMIYNELSDPEDLPTQETFNDISDPEELPTQATISEASLDEPMPDVYLHSSLSDEKEENLPNQQATSAKKFYPKFVTLLQSEVEKFKQKLFIDRSNSIYVSEKIVKEKIYALGRVHYWLEIHTYDIEKYAKYWAKVCVTFWDKPLVRGHRLACLVSRSYANNNRRILRIDGKKKYFDFLSCRCHTYSTHCRMPLSTPESFLLHKGVGNEFFIFEEKESGGNITITGFKTGITLPNPSNFDKKITSGQKFFSKTVTLRSFQIELFTRALTINTSYPGNISLVELEGKLMESEEIHEWPGLFKYNYMKYSIYWANVCILFWGKQLDSSHRHACTIYPSLGENKLRKLFLQNRAQHFDLLYCKCFSYIKNFRTPASNADTFLIHQSSVNEFFVFDQHATELCKYTLFIKDFKGGITLPNPENFNWTIVS